MLYRTHEAVEDARLLLDVADRLTPLAERRGLTWSDMATSIPAGRPKPLASRRERADLELRTSSNVPVLASYA